jgi:hypothetical protein
VSPRPDLDALDRLMRQSGGMPPAPIPAPLHKIAMARQAATAVVISFPYVPSPERTAEILARSDEAWPEYERDLDAKELREANAKHAGRWASRLRVVR